jgi:non-ribosomal peptide synthetase component E (peptide arylation enzyme)
MLILFQIEFIDEIPLAAVGIIDKKVLRSNIKTA